MVFIKELTSSKVIFKSAVRAVSLKSLTGNGQSIQGAEKHAKREDPISHKRSIHPENKPIAWSKAGSVEKALDYVEAFKVHKKEFSAGERKSSALALEFKLIISPEWLEKAGDPHDRDNPHVKAFFENAKEWAESWGGQGSVWGLRYDTDEAGSGVVDVFMSPIRDQKHKNGKNKQVISCNKAKDELLIIEQALDPSLKTSGAAMQSSWARWCQKQLDPQIERGERKEFTGHEHIHMDKFKKLAEKAKLQVQIELNERMTQLSSLQIQLSHQKIAQDKKQKTLEEVERVQKEREAQFKFTEIELQNKKRKLEVERQEIEALRETANKIIQKNRITLKIIEFLVNEDVKFLIKWGLSLIGYENQPIGTMKNLYNIKEPWKLVSFNGLTKLSEFVENDHHSLFEICKKTYETFLLFLQDLTKYIKKEIKVDPLIDPAELLRAFFNAAHQFLLETIQYIKEKLLEQSYNDHSIILIKAIYEYQEEKDYSYNDNHFEL